MLYPIPGRHPQQLGFVQPSFRQVLDGIPLSKAEQQQADEKFSGKAGPGHRSHGDVAMGALEKPRVSSIDG